MEIKPYNPRDWKSHPPYRFEGYTSSMKRAPLRRLVKMKQTLSEITGPLFGPEAVQPGDTDLTRNAGTDGEAMGERVIIVGRVLDEDQRPVPNTLIEIWQANAAGRYHHEVDQHRAPLDPNFIGAGRCMRLKRRAFVDRLDFLTSPGHLTGGDSRARSGLPGGGPELVITDKAILNFDNPEREMQLSELYPGVTVKDVQAEVGWELRLAATIGETAGPTVEELHLIRDEVDPQGMYR